VTKESNVSCPEWLLKNQWCVSIAGATLLAILIATSILLVRSSRSAALDEEPFIARLKTSFFFWLGMGYLVLLLVVGAFYALQTGNGKPYMLGGLLPVAVPWFGALGAVTISLAGVFFYGHSGWDRKYNYWHIGRPFFGAVLGIIAFFMFVLIISSAGTQIPFLETPDNAKSKDFVIYYVLAFLVGYREKTFRELIQRVTDLILNPGQQAADSPQIVFKQNGSPKTSFDFGTVPVNTTSSVTIDVENVGKGSLPAAYIALDNPSGAPFTISASLPPGMSAIKPGASVPVVIDFTPTTQGNATAALVVTGGNPSGPAILKLRGAA
jgi:Abnormal spindle-like microcephaly-assoc'd, ASPM-SPD-2-Hydin